MTADCCKELLSLSSQDLAVVQRILKCHVPDKAVWAFGSRVKGGARKFSDLDMAVVTSEPLSLSVMADLKEAFAESDLVFKVDVVDWAVTSEAFRRIIEEEKVVLQAGQ